jgi:hypothetical protein
MTNSPILIHALSFVRALTTRENYWLAGDLRAGECVKGGQSIMTKDLASQTFTNADDEGVSVYECKDHGDEVAVASALNVARNKAPKSPVLLLRMPAWMVRRFDIRVSQTTGTTGIGRVDAMHRDLLGKPSSFHDITVCLLEERCLGLDLVRQVQPPSLLRCYLYFVGLPAEEVSEDTREKARKLVSSS